MLSRLRRSALIPVLLLALSPAVGVTVLPAIHPCPVDMPWLAAGHGSHQTGSGHEGHGGQHRQQPAQSVCHCVGACTQASVPVSLPATALRLAPPVEPTRVAVELVVVEPPAVRPRFLLPPATAPPLA